MRKHTVVPPLHAMDPELGIAERLPRNGDRRLRGIATRLPDEQAAARRRNASTGAAWRIAYVTPVADAGELAAGLAALVTVGGWWRVKLCATCGGRPARKRCAEHVTAGGWR